MNNLNQILNSKARPRKTQILPHPNILKPLNGKKGQITLKRFRSGPVSNKESAKGSYPSRTLSSLDKEESSLLFSKKEKRWKSFNKQNSKFKENKENINTEHSNNLMLEFYKPKVPNIGDKIKNINKSSQFDVSNLYSSSTIGKKSMVSVNRLKLEFSSSEKLNELNVE